MKILKFIFADAFLNIFALVAITYCGYMLKYAHLSIQSETRHEDFIGMVIGFYFLANAKSSKTSDTLNTMAETQKHMAVNAAPETSDDVIKSGDPVTVTKEKGDN